MEISITMLFKKTCRNVIFFEPLLLTKSEMLKNIKQRAVLNFIEI